MQLLHVKSTYSIAMEFTGQASISFLDGFLQSELFLVSCTISSLVLLPICSWMSYSLLTCSWALVLSIPQNNNLRTLWMQFVGLVMSHGFPKMFVFHTIYIFLDCKHKKRDFKVTHISGTNKLQHHRHLHKTSSMPNLWITHQGSGSWILL